MSKKQKTTQVIVTLRYPPNMSAGCARRNFREVVRDQYRWCNREVEETLVSVKLAKKAAP